MHKNDNDDHSYRELLRTIVEDKDSKLMKSNPHENASITGDYVSRCFASALCNSIANSMLNNASDKLIPLSLDDIQKQLEEVVRPLNANENVKDLSEVDFTR